MVHHVLECCRGVAEAKVHDHGFIQAVLCFECCFVLISIFDVYFVEAPFYVEFGEDERVLYFCDQFWYKGKWVSVVNCPFVNASIILYWPL